MPKEQLWQHPNGGMAISIVKWFNADKSFGFITLEVERVYK
ncbi:MAG: cold-shock protein [Colwellia sp.]|nr:cold-shock protein [Colwellia sp.]